MAGTLMRSHMLRAALLALNFALLIVLLALWVDTKGQLRRIHWMQPAPLGLDAAGIAAKVRKFVKHGKELTEEGLA